MANTIHGLLVHNLGILCQIVFSGILRITAEFSLHQISPFPISHVPKFPSPGTRGRNLCVFQQMLKKMSHSFSSRICVKLSKLSNILSNLQKCLLSFQISVSQTVYSVFVKCPRDSVRHTDGDSGRVRVRDRESLRGMDRDRDKDKETDRDSGGDIGRGKGRDKDGSEQKLGQGKGQ